MDPTRTPATPICERCRRPIDPGSAARKPMTYVDPQHQPHVVCQGCWYGWLE